MTSTHAPTPELRRYWQVPSLDNEDRLAGGVASGIAHELGVDPLWIRLCFVLLFALGGWGGLLYLVAWGGLSFLSYRGHQPSNEPIPKALTERHRAAGIALVMAGLVSFAGQLGGLQASVLWPLGVTVSGVLVALRTITPRSDGLLPDWFPSAQLLGGVVAAIGVYAMSRSLGISGGGGGVVVAACAVGIVVVSAPWWWQLVSQLDRERQARARADERAEVAAHIHDSVLQTLALIQKSDDPRQIAQLARRQERELRNYLDPDRADRAGGSIRGRLDEMTSDLEALHGVPIELVCVSDAIIDPRIDGLLAATREAVVNAAKHAGVDQIDVYVEVRPDVIEIFVRDTGVGFDPATIAGDRRGLRDSIRARMERLGGSAEIHSSPGEGTEVELSLPHSTSAPGPPRTGHRARPEYR